MWLKAKVLWVHSVHMYLSFLFTDLERFTLTTVVVTRRHDRSDNIWVWVSLNKIVVFVYLLNYWKTIWPRLLQSTHRAEEGLPCSIDPNHPWKTWYNGPIAGHIDPYANAHWIGRRRGAVPMDGYLTKVRGQDESVNALWMALNL